MKEWARRLRRGTAAIEVAGKTVLLVDDGVATGGTASAALQCLRQRDVRRLVFAVPVAPLDTVRELASLADEVVCLHPQANERPVALSYEEFRPPSEEQVTELLHRSLLSPV